MNKTLISLLVAAALVGCSDDDGSTAETGAGIDPLTGTAMQMPVVSDDAAVATDGTAAGPTSSAALTAVLNRDSYGALVEQAFAVYTGAAYGSDVLALPPYPGLRGQALDGTGYEGSVSSTDTCDNGGTAALSMDWGGARVTTFDRRGAFDGCLSGDRLIDGEIQLLTLDNESVSSSGLSIVQGDTTTRFSGGASYGDGNNYGGSPQRWWYASELDWTIVDGESVRTSITDATTRFDTVPAFQYDLSGAFTMRSPATGDREIAVQTREPFEARRQPSFESDVPLDVWNFDTGVLRMTAADGSRVTVDADSGDVETVLVTLEANGERDTFERPWSEWSAVLRAGPSPSR